jgi:hypothetical protein
MSVNQPQQVVAPDAPMTRFQAQRALGLFARFDYTIWGVLALLWVTLGFWKLFGSPTALNLIAMAIVNITIMQVYIIVLVFRAIVFILDTNADINLMPEAAARIVVGFWEGRRK